jgi:hypothetical protein
MGRQNRSYPGVDTCGTGEGEWGGKRRGRWWMHFVYVHENSTVKPAEIVLRRGEG